MQNNSLGIALILSIATHSLFLMILLPGIESGFHGNSQMPAPLETAYSPSRVMEKKTPSQSNEPIPDIEPSRPDSAKKEKRLFPDNSPVLQSKTKQSQNPEPIRPQVVKQAPVSPKNEVVLASPGSHSLSHPFLPTSAQEGMAYMNYFEVLRDRIQVSVRYPKEWAAGEVYISFVIKSNGNLKLDTINILENGSTNNRFLREAAIQSIMAASPFPQFPKGLNRQEICFNIPLVYQYNQR